METSALRNLKVRIWISLETWFSCVSIRILHHFWASSGVPPGLQLLLQKPLFCHWSLRYICQLHIVVLRALRLLDGIRHLYLGSWILSCVSSFLFLGYSSFTSGCWFPSGCWFLLHSYLSVISSVHLAASPVRSNPCDVSLFTSCFYRLLCRVQSEYLKEKLRKENQHEVTIKLCIDTNKNSSDFLVTIYHGFQNNLGCRKHRADIGRGHDKILSKVYLTTEGKGSYPYSYMQ